MIIYLDESGDLGFDFNLSRTSHYLIMTCLICRTRQSIQAVKRAIKLTLKNKLAANTTEVKGSNTLLTIKNYCFKQLKKNNDWEIISIAADKKAWLNHYGKSPSTLGKNLFYDEVAKRLLSQIVLPADSSHIQIIVDKSKTQSALKEFDDNISLMIRTSMPYKTKLSIYHRQSHIEPGLQATDLFSWGIYRKYQWNDSEWYDIFKCRIALEMKFKF